VVLIKKLIISPNQDLSNPSTLKISINNKNLFYALSIKATLPCIYLCVFLLQKYLKLSKISSQNLNLFYQKEYQYFFASYLFLRGNSYKFSSQKDFSQFERVESKFGNKNEFL